MKIECKSATETQRTLKSYTKVGLGFFFHSWYCRVTKDMGFLSLCNSKKIVVKLGVKMQKKKMHQGMDSMDSLFSKE